MGEGISRGKPRTKIGQKRIILLKIGKKILMISFGFSKIMLVYLIFSYFCKYPNQLISIPTKMYGFSRRFYDSLEIYSSKLFKKSKVINVVDKSKDIIVEFVDRNTYYDLDDRLNSKFYKTCVLVTAFLAFRLRSYLNKKSPGDDFSPELTVDFINEIIENTIDDN